jgi:methionine-gamma-lyase
MDPHQAWLALRGLKTLALRVRASQDNARVIASFLEAHPDVDWVRYPGLASHPQHLLAGRQMDGPGALISFEVKGGVEAGRQLLDHVRLMTLAVSLGGIETLIQHPASMTHAAMHRDDRLAAGISDGLVRVSVGCEDADDLIADFAQALSSVRLLNPVATG